ncbi:YbaB/EbfC family nucleoid-associated protein [bacterium]|nr:YbaB/EbfC family nucleoid-associated protein [bacterium]
MNIMQMMQQAQNIQKKLKDAQEELAKTEVEGEALGGAVKVICDGQGKFKSIKLSAELINPEHPEEVDEDTIETLEDAIITAITQTTKKATDDMEAKIKSITGGISIPGLC